MSSDTTVEIGNDTGVTGIHIMSQVGVKVGNRVLCGPDVVITDSDWHPIDEVPRRYLPAPVGSAEDRVVIEDDVFLGTQVKVLKGVRIGAGTVVAAGSIVSKSLPAGVLAAGIPAEVVRRLDLDTITGRG